MPETTRSAYQEHERLMEELLGKNLSMLRFASSQPCAEYDSDCEEMSLKEIRHCAALDRSHRCVMIEKAN